MNHLESATSPYLRSAAHQPIAWQEWGAAAFAEAQRRHVPVLISSGFATCHWCHVMAAETFDDGVVAKFVNEQFVAVKVDRQERPDVDAALLSATQALTGQGGWPMTVFATPSGVPFFAGTYFPAQRLGNQPSFRQVCETIVEAWTTRGDEVVLAATQIAEHVASFGAVVDADSPAIWPLLEQVSSEFDLLHGGFGTEPKFPQPTLLDALLVKGEPGCLDLAQRTAEAMARGGVFDQVGGGFHRYAVDAAWTVPHFEKLLGDNALLLGAYLRTWRRTADHDGPLRALYERVIYATIGWLERDLRLESGLFAAGLDADSSDIRGVAHEGAYYLWNAELLTDALGAEDGQWAARTFHATDELAPLVLTGRVDFERLDRVLPQLLTERSSRFAPARDESVIAAWNGWTIEALTWAALIFDEPHWLDLATTCAGELWRTHWVDGELRRLSAGAAGDAAAGASAGAVAGAAEDYAAVATAFARLSGALGEPVWLERAVSVLRVANEQFSAADGGFFDAVASDLFVRPRSFTDAVYPAGAAALIEAFQVVGVLAQRPDFCDRAAAAMPTLWGSVAAAPRQSGAALAQLLIDDEARTGLGRARVVVADSPLSDLARAAWRMAPAGSVITVAAAGLAEGQAQVCRGGTCLPPVSAIEDLRTALWSRC